MIKKHSIKESKLYKLYSKSTLANLLGCSNNFINYFNNNRNHYHNRFEPKKSGRGKREINNPGASLKNMHRRLLGILKQIEPPAYLKSGVKGISVADIANLHKMCNYMLCLDISSFYRYARIEYVRKLFITEFKMAPNLAEFISKLVTIPSEDKKTQYIPTGSPISQIIVFWAYKHTFDEIDTIAKQNDIKVSLYVDDMTFSSEKNIPKSFEYFVMKRLKSVGLNVKLEKTKRYGPTDDKVTVGVQITKKHEIKITDKNRYKIISFMTKQGRISTWTFDLLIKCRGMIVAAQQKEPNFMMTTKKRLDAEIKKYKQSNPMCTKRTTETKTNKNKIKTLPTFDNHN